MKKSTLLGLTGVAVPHLGFSVIKKSTPTTFDPSVRPKVIFFDVNEALLDLTAKKQRLRLLV